KAMAGRRSPLARTLALVLRLPPEVGRGTSVRILRNLLASARPVQSLALETYWSRGAILWGDAGPVRYRLRPVAPVASSRHSGLREELACRLAAGSVVFDLAVQRFVSEDRTPVEDTSRGWTDEDAPPESVARLIIPRQDLDTAEAHLIESRIEQLAFNPWNTSEEFR